jgi:hypothetical protein
VSQGEGDVSIGETLAEARRQASLTVPQVSDQTRAEPRSTDRHRNAWAVW